MKSPLVSIIIPTFNSQLTLERVLLSIKNQSYPSKCIEVLVIDGMSKDNTRNIAKKYGAKVINNSKVGFVPGKHLGYLKAKGDYLLHLDSDEEILDTNSIYKKISAFKKDTKIKGVIGSGYKNPQNISAISRYINEFGDPFSYFIYRQTINNKFFLKQWVKRYPVIHSDDQFTVFNLNQIKPLPLIELYAGGGMIDLKYFKNKYPQIDNTPSLVTHYFYLLNLDRKLFAITKDDPLIHYSSTTFKRYLSKISWRIRNNIFHKKDTGLAGFIGRDEFQPSWFRLKRFLFLPYSICIILSVFDALYLTLTRKDWIFLLHPFLCLYTSILIVFYYGAYLLGIKINEPEYGS